METTLQFKPIIVAKVVKYVAVVVILVASLGFFVCLRYF